MATLRSLLANIALLLFSVLFCLLLAEGATRVLQAADVLPEFNRDTLHKGFRQPGKTLNAKTVPSKDEVLFHEYDLEDPRINNAGHRDTDFLIEKPNNTLRIALLGDSVAYGFGVPVEATFADRLEQSLSTDARPVEVYNFAVSGYGTESHRRLFDTKIKAYKPDVLLLAYVLNDPLPNNLIVTVLKDLMKTGKFYEDLSAKTQFGAWLYLQYHNYNDQQKTHRNYESIFEDDKTWGVLNTHLAHFKQEMDGKFAVVTVPLLLDYENYRFASIHQQLISAMSEQNIPALDLLEAYSAHDYMALRIHPQDNTHPNELGHEIAAKEITAFLKQTELLAD